MLCARVILRDIGSELKENTEPRVRCAVTLFGRRRQQFQAARLRSGILEQDLGELILRFGEAAVCRAVVPVNRPFPVGRRTQEEPIRLTE